MTILAVTGLQREAAIARRAGVMAVACGGDFAALRSALKDVGEVDGVISFGIAAGLAPGLKPGTVIIGSEVPDSPNRYFTNDAWREAMHAKLPQARLDAVTGVNFILDTPRAKESLRKECGAVAADMESHIAGMFAEGRNVPFAVLRAIADSAECALPDAALNALRPDGSVDYPAVFGSIAKNPTQIPALIRTGWQSQLAFAALLRSVKALGPFFAAPDLG